MLLIISDNGCQIKAVNIWRMSLNIMRLYCDPDIGTKTVFKSNLFRVLYSSNPFNWREQIHQM